MLLGPLAFLLLAGVVVVFDPLIVMGKEPVPRPEHKPGVPAHPAVPHPPRRLTPRTRRIPARSTSRTPQNR
ncbi:hypothetical protein GCM10020295_63560 [Streptomyces cinereospinus]